MEITVTIPNSKIPKIRPAIAQLLEPEDAVDINIPTDAELLAKIKSIWMGDLKRIVNDYYKSKRDDEFIVEDLGTS